MWALIIALWMDATSPEMTYIQLAQTESYQQCSDLATMLKRSGLEAHLFCVQQQ